jgi:hypothetical protein
MTTSIDAALSDIDARRSRLHLVTPGCGSASKRRTAAGGLEITS